MSFSYYYKVLHPSTAVEHCLTANFTAPHHLNLILAKTNILEIYRLVENSNKDELKFITSVELFGNIRSITATKFAGNKRDSLLILFEEEAKISVVDYDQSNFDLKTVSLHYLEDEYLKEGKCAFTSPSRLVMDPYNRCSATLFFDSKLVVIPFREETTLQLMDTSLDQRSEVPVRRHKVIDMKELNLLNIKDYCFLHGYSFQPTILILHENEPTWSGRYAMKYKTCAITAISLDLNGEKHPIIWHVPHLPHDCYRLIPLKDTVGGGVLIASFNGFIHVNQKISYVLSLNDMFQPIQEHNIILETSPNAMILDFVAYTFLAQDRILFSLRKGELYCLYLNGSGRTVNQIQFVKLTTSVIASSMCTIANRDLFIASRLGDSLLISYKEKLEAKRENGSSVEDGGQKKRQKLDDGAKKAIDLDAADDFLSLLEEDETDESYSSKNRGSLTQYELKLLDSFLGIGPAHSVDIGNAKITSDIKKGTLQLVACSGYSKNGSISVLTQHLRSEMILEQDLPFQCKNMWTIKQRDNKGNIFDAYLIISTENSTKVLYAGEGLDEVTNSSTMKVSEQTIMIGNCMSSGRSIQICKNNILLLDGNKEVLEYQLSDRTIYKAHVVDPYVLLHFTSGDILILEVSQNKFERVKKTNLSHHGFGKVTACNLFKLGAPLESFEMQNVSNNFVFFFCIVCWSSGAIEMYSIPEFKLVFVFTQFISMHSIVYDSNLSKSDMKDFKSAAKDSVKNLYVKQVVLRSVGDMRDDPHLFVLLNDNSLVIYRSFFYNNATLVPDRLSKLRFKKLRVDYLQNRIRESSPNMPKLDFTNPNNIFPTTIEQNELVAFDQVGKYSGLFQTGNSPVWIFSDRGKLRVHPMAVDGEVGAFASLHAARFKFGFAYFGVKSQKFRLCQLDSTTACNATWPTKRIQLSVTPQKVIFHEQTDTYLVAVSKTVVAEIPEDVEMLPEGRFPIPTEERSEIKVFSQNWKQIDQYSLEVHEQVLSASVLMLANFDLEADEDEEDQHRNQNWYSNQEEENAKKDRMIRPYIVIGTGYTEGEDQAGKGRILIFDFEAQISEENKRVYKLVRVARERTVKGPVSAVAAVDGFLLATAGPKIMVFMYDNDTKKIQECGFYDAQFYIPSMITIKDYVLYGDVLKSLNFLRWKEKGHKMLLLSKDSSPLRVTSTGLLIHNNTIGFIAADAKKNLKVFTYKPAASLGGFRGKKLVPVADFHTGLSIHNLLRIQTESAMGSLVFSALDGSIGMITPIDERIARVFTLLQNKMYTQLPHACGLHPKRYRLFEPQEYTAHATKKNIMDGQLLNQFHHLDYENQRIFSNSVGTRLDVILDALEALYSRGIIF